MTSFIYTSKGYINLDRVQMAQFTKSGQLKIVVGDVVVDDKNVGFGSTIISTVPVQGDWESLSICSEDDGSHTMISEPVLAWGLTALGYLTPITPTEMNGAERSDVLRKAGDARVYTPDTTYENAEDWLADVTKPENVVRTGT